MAHNFGYSLIKSSPNYFGNLKMSQLESVVDGMCRHEKRKADSIKSSGKPGRIELSQGNIHSFPGVKVIKRKK